MAETREPQYQRCLELRDQFGLAQLGLMANQTWCDDPRRLVFMLARYKFVAQMLAGRGHVLEAGCGDAFGTRIVQQNVDKVMVVDFDPVLLDDVKSRIDPRWPLECREHDLLSGPVPGDFDAAYSLDVIEHIPAEDEDRFVANLAGSISEHGVLVVGSPSLESQEYASAPSRAGHVNCKTGPQYRELFLRHFHNVFLFSMNDEVVHTGFAAMAHYRFALCCSKRDAS